MFWVGFLRVSGGVSGYMARDSEAEGFSPRKRRCFYEGMGQDWRDRVFSA